MATTHPPKTLLHSPRLIRKRPSSVPQLKTNPHPVDYLAIRNPLHCLEEDNHKLIRIRKPRCLSLEEEPTLNPRLPLSSVQLDRPQLNHPQEDYLEVLLQTKAIAYLAEAVRLRLEPTPLRTPKRCSVSPILPSLLMPRVQRLSQPLAPLSSAAAPSRHKVEACSEEESARLSHRPPNFLEEVREQPKHHKEDLFLEEDPIQRQPTAGLNQPPSKLQQSRVFFQAHLSNPSLNNLRIQSSAAATNPNMPKLNNSNP